MFSKCYERYSFGDMVVRSASNDVARSKAEIGMNGTAHARRFFRRPLGGVTCVVNKTKRPEWFSVRSRHKGGNVHSIRHLEFHRRYV